MRRSQDFSAPALQWQLPFKDDIRRPDRDNIIDGFINRNEEDVCADGIWQKYFKTRPEPLTDEEIKNYLSGISGVSLGSDAFSRLMII